MLAFRNLFRLFEYIQNYFILKLQFVFKIIRFLPIVFYSRRIHIQRPRSPAMHGISSLSYGHRQNRTSPSHGVTADCLQNVRTRHRCSPDPQRHDAAAPLLPRVSDLCPNKDWRSINPAHILLLVFQLYCLCQTSS